MVSLVLLVFGVCFIAISLIVFLACMLLGADKDIASEYEESIRMKRFMRKYLEHRNEIKDHSAVA